MLYESKALPKTPLGIVSVKSVLNEIPLSEHADVIEAFRVELVETPWDPRQKALGDLLEQMAASLDSSSGDMSKIPPALVQQTFDAAGDLNWRMDGRDRFFDIRARLGALLLANR